jgi:hypothetical protein
VRFRVHRAYDRGVDRGDARRAVLFEGNDPLFGNGGATIDGDTLDLYERGFAVGFECKVARVAVSRTPSCAAPPRR